MTAVKVAVRLSLFGTAPKPNAMIFTKYGEQIIPKMTIMPTTINNILKTLLARRFCLSLPFCFSVVKTGMKAADRAVSAKWNSETCPAVFQKFVDFDSFLVIIL